MLHILCPSHCMHWTFMVNVPVPLCGKHFLFTYVVMKSSRNFVLCLPFLIWALSAKAEGWSNTMFQYNFKHKAKYMFYFNYAIQYSLRSRENVNKHFCLFWDLWSVLLKGKESSGDILHLKRIQWSCCSTLLSKDLIVSAFALFRQSMN